MNFRAFWNGAAVLGVSMLIVSCGAPKRAVTAHRVADAPAVHFDSEFSRRAEAALIRVRAALQRAGIALERIDAELGINPERTQVPIRLPVLSRPETRQALDSLSLEVFRAWTEIISVRSVARARVAALTPAKPEIEGVPKWIEPTNLITPASEQSEPLSRVRYIERAAFLIEQAAQEVEIAEDQAITVGAQRRRTSTSAPLGWREIGPRMIPEGEGYDGSRVDVSGRVTSLAVDPNWPDTVYVGAAFGGVWRSDDRGQTWHTMSDPGAELSVGAMSMDAMHPADLLVGTGEANVALRELLLQGDRLIPGQHGAGVLRSRDGGRTWSQGSTTPIGTAAFSSFARIRDGERLVVLAATTKGLLRSRDGGESWERLVDAAQIGESAVTDVIAGGESRTGALVGVWGRGVFRIEDAFATVPVWTRLTLGLPLSNLSRVALASSRANPQRVFALVANADSFLRGMYVSDDRGQTWSQIANAPDLLQGQGFFNVLLSAHPTDPNVVFIGGAGRRGQHSSSLYRATLSKGHWYFAPIGQHLHVDFHAIAFDPRDSKRFYVGNDGGVWRTDDGGISWTACNNGLAIAQVMSLDQDANSETIVVGVQDNGTLIFREGKWSHVDDGDGGNVRFDPRDSNVVYNEYKTYRLARSKSGGAAHTFVPVHPQFRTEPFTAFASSYDFDPAHGNIALAVDGVFVTPDDGSSWTRIPYEFTTPDEGVKVSTISALKYDVDGALYVGTSHGSVARATPQGPGWSVTTVVKTDGYVTSIAVERDGSSKTIMIGTNGGLWTCRSAVARLMCAREDSFPPGAIYSINITNHIALVGSDAGVYCSRAPFVAWRRLGVGLPRVPVFQVQHHPSRSLIRAGTFGRGVWELAPNSSVATVCG